MNFCTIQIMLIYFIHTHFCFLIVRACLKMRDLSSASYDLKKQSNNQFTIYIILMSYLNVYSHIF